MGFTSYPQPLQKSAQAYINAGITYNSANQYQFYTSPIGSSISMYTGASSGYGYTAVPTGQTTSLNLTVPTSASYGSTWFLEVYVPSVTLNTTVAQAITTTTTDSPSTGSGSNVISIANTNGIVTGMLVSGSGIAAGTTVTSNASGGTVQISANTVSPIFRGTTLTFTTPGGTWPAGTQYLPLAITPNLYPGQGVTCTGLATNTYAFNSTGNLVYLSAPTGSSIAAGTAFTSTPAITWSGVSWHNNVTPTQAIGGRSIYMFTTSGDGSTIYGRQIMANLAGSGL